MTRPRRQKASAGFLWRWLDDVEELSRADENLTTAQRSTIRHIATKKARSADPDGRNCYPSQESLARYAGVHRDSVRWAEGWLTLAGLQVLTKHAGRGTSNHYRLIRPSIDALEQGHPNDGKMPSAKGIQADLDALEDALQDALPQGHNRLPTNREEEESAGARSANAPLAALCPDLFDDDGAGHLEGAPEPEPSSIERRLKESDLASVPPLIARKAGVAIDTEILGPALIEAAQRTGWSPDGLAVYCVEKLQQNRGKVRRPSPFLATDLATVHAGMTPSPRMELKEAISELSDLAGLLAEAGLERPEPCLYDAWLVKPAQVEQVLGIVQGVVQEARQRLDARPPPINLFPDVEAD